MIAQISLKIQSLRINDAFNLLYIQDITFYRAQLIEDYQLHFGLMVLVYILLLMILNKIHNLLFKYYGYSLLLTYSWLFSLLISFYIFCYFICLVHIIVNIGNYFHLFPIAYASDYQHAIQHAYTTDPLLITNPSLVTRQDGLDYLAQLHLDATILTTIRDGFEQQISTSILSLDDQMHYRLIINEHNEDLAINREEQRQTNIFLQEFNSTISSTTSSSMSSISSTSTTSTSLVDSVKPVNRSNPIRLDGAFHANIDFPISKHTNGHVSTSLIINRQNVDLVSGVGIRYSSENLLPMKVIFAGDLNLSTPLIGNTSSVKVLKQGSLTLTPIGDWNKFSFTTNALLTKGLTSSSVESLSAKASINYALTPDAVISFDVSKLGQYFRFALLFKYRSYSPYSFYIIFIKFMILFFTKIITFFFIIINCAFLGNSISRHNLHLVFADATEPCYFDVQDPATSIAEGIINLHDDVIFLLVWATTFVITFIFTVVYFFTDTKNKTIMYFPTASHDTKLEFIWTSVPSLILITIIVPTFALIYSLDDTVDAHLTIKIIGHQWYWSYEYGDIAETLDHTVGAKDQSYSFDSYIKAEDELISGHLRLLEVDQRLILPTQVHIRLIITSTDVIHSWAVPSLGIKLDCCPGRLNQVGLYIDRPGVFYGQCSEICGINHAFIPICIEAVYL